MDHQSTNDLLLRELNLPRDENAKLKALQAEYINDLKTYHICMVGG